MKRIAAVALIATLAMALATTAVVAGDDVKWHKDWKAAQDAAKKSKKPILVLLVATDHEPSSDLEVVFGEDEVKKHLGSFELVKIDVDDKAEDVEKLDALTGVTLEEVPEIRIVTHEGKLVDHAAGSHPAKKVAALLEAALKKVKG